MQTINEEKFHHLPLRSNYQLLKGILHIDKQTIYKNILKSTHIKNE